MRRTQIQLDERTHSLVRNRAHERGISMAALIREAVEAHLEPVPRRRMRFEDLTFVASGRSEPSQFDPISENHDDALAENTRW